MKGKLKEKVEMSARTLQDFEYDVLEPLCSDARKAGLKGDNMKRACNQAYSALVSKGFGVSLYNFSENKAKSRKSLNESYDFSGCSGIPELTDTFATYFRDETENYFINLDPDEYADIGRALIRVNNSQMKKESRQAFVKKCLTAFKESKK